MMASALSAQQLLVPSQYASIQAAIDAAADGDTVLVAEGTYLENINFLGKPITVASMFALDGDTSHISKTIIDGSQGSNLDTCSTVTFWNKEDTTSVLCGFTITGGKGTRIKDSYRTAYCGGGVFMMSCGGKIINNIIEENHLEATRGYYGCGLYAHSTPQYTAIIRNNIIRNNTGTNNGGWGAGVHLFGGKILFEDNLVTKNSFDVQGLSIGAGIFVWLGQGMSGEDTDFILRNNEISYNHAGGTPGNCAGGGLGFCYNYAEGIPQVYNNIIANNISDGWGGGLYLFANETDVYNNTIVDNIAGVEGNSICLEGNARAILFNNIVWSEPGNSVSDIGHYGNGGSMYALNNILSESYLEDSRHHLKHNTYFEPAFVGESYKLAEGSVAIGRAAKTVEINGKIHQAPAFDCKGDHRPCVADEYVDIGAYESNYEAKLMDDAFLLMLALGPFEIQPEFNKTTFDYEMVIPDTIGNWDLFTAEPYDVLSDLTINHAVNLEGTEEERTTTVNVISSDETVENVYSILFTALSYNCLLKSLEIDGPGYLVPEFDPEVINYYAYVPGDSDGVPDLIYEAEDEKASIEYIPADSLTGSFKYRKAKVIVTAEHDKITRQYSIIYDIDDTTGIEHALSEKMLRIYPNPSSDIFTLELNTPVQGEIEIHGLKGQLIHRQPLRSEKEIIDLSLHPKGIYFVTVRSDDRVRTEKVVRY
jgi:hypothetical protein